MNQAAEFGVVYHKTRTVYKTKFKRNQFTNIFPLNIKCETKMGFNKSTLHSSMLNCIQLLKNLMKKEHNFLLYFTTVKLNECQDLLNWYQTAEFSGVYHDTQLEGN